MLGPCRFSHWADVEDLAEHRDSQTGIPYLRLGDPVGKENEVAWIQVVAVSETQTKNTMKLFGGMISKKLMAAHGMTKLDIGKTFVSAYKGTRVIEAVTSNPRTLEGGRPSFVIRNETHHWIDSNGGHELAEVIERNATKSAGGQARALSITNAYEPSENSVAQSQREAWEEEQEASAINTGVLYDSVEAPEGISMRPPEAAEWKGEPKTPEERTWREKVIISWLSAIVQSVRGDATWLDIESIVFAIVRRRSRNGETVTQSQARRFWFNNIVAAEDSWADNGAITAAIEPMLRDVRAVERGHDQLRAGWIVDPDDPIVMFFDGSKSDDATGLVGCRMSDGYTFVIGVWQKPKGDAGEGWLSPRGEVDMRVTEAFERFNVVAFWGDPSHTLDDDNSRYWDGYLDRWHQKFKDRLQVWATQSGHGTSATMWDMATRLHTEQFAAAAEMVRTDLHVKDHEGNYAPLFSIDGHPALRAHLRNAKENRILKSDGTTVVSLRKNNRESNKKIDLAVCLVGAHMLRRIVANAGLEEEEEGTDWFASA